MDGRTAIRPAGAGAGGGAIVATMAIVSVIAAAVGAAGCRNSLASAELAPVPRVWERTADPENPDPSARLVFGPSEEFERAPRSATRLAAADALFHVREARARAASHVMMFFAVREDVPQHRTLEAYCAWANEQARSAVGDREARRMEVSPARDPFARAAVRWAVYSFEEGALPGEPAREAVGGSGVIRFETPGGFWTAVWNLGGGQLDVNRATIERFIETIEVQIVEPGGTR